MPKLRPYSEAERRAEEAKNQRERVIRIINAASMVCEYDRMPELCGIANALKMDVQTRAALCGAKEKCRYETGYRI